MSARNSEAVDSVRRSLNRAYEALVDPWFVAVILTVVYLTVVLTTTGRAHVALWHVGTIYGSCGVLLTLFWVKKFRANAREVERLLNLYQGETGAILEQLEATHAWTIWIFRRLGIIPKP